MNYNLELFTFDSNGGFLKLLLLLLFGPLPVGRRWLRCWRRRGRPDSALRRKRLSSGKLIGIFALDQRID